MTTNLYERERTLAREVTQRVESGVPGVEVLAVELASPDRFCVFIDHAGGVDHSLCERVSRALREYSREYSVEVSSPGLERPLRTSEHFGRVLGRRVALKTSPKIDGRKHFRGELKEVGERGVVVDVDGADVAIPYEVIVRGNLIEEVRER